MRRVVGLVVLLLAVAVLPAQAAKDGLDEYAYFTFKGQQENLIVLVDTLPAYINHSEKQEYLFLPIAVGLYGHTGSVMVTLEGFKLIDASGKEYSPASYKTILQYGQRNTDEMILRERPMITGNLFSTYRQQGSSFYPVTGSRGLAGNAVDLAPFGYFTDVLYFPNPGAGLDDVLTLQISSKDLDEPMVTKFKVKTAKNKKKK